MNFSSEQIEAITQGVLRELSSRGISISAARQGTDVCGNKSGSTVEGISERVITEEVLSGSRASQGRIAIPADAVITPSGRDYLRRHGLSVVRGQSSKTKASAGSLLTIGHCGSVTAAATSLGWTISAAACEFDAARQSIRLAGGQPVICCGGVATAVACLLNRDTGVRAAVASAGDDPEPVFRLMKPQVMCMNSKGWSFVETVRLMRLMSTSGQAPPAKWRELAGGMP